jgi:hypothetical protein
MYKRMGLDLLVVGNVRQYIDTVVALGMNIDHNRAVRKSIAHQAGVLFEHQDEITSWEFVLRKWVENTP